MPTQHAAALDPPRSVRELALAVTACTACGLHRDRRSPIVGAGPADARLMIVGSVPRRHEDLQGDPLAGATGNVLRHALGHAGLSADEVRVSTIVRCRPRHDRAPTEAEMRACHRHLVDELALVDPEVVVALGALPTAVLLGRPVPIERVAGYRLVVFQGATLVPTYHPADVLRGVPQADGALRRDLTIAKAVLDGRLATGAQALASQQARQAAGE